MYGKGDSDMVEAGVDQSLCVSPSHWSLKGLLAPSHVGLVDVYWKRRALLPHLQKDPSFLHRDLEER